VLFIVLKIHSSSVHIPPSGNQTNKPQHPANHSQDSTTVSDNSAHTPSNVTEFAAAAEQENQQQLKVAINSNQVLTPLNAKSQKAVAAYTDIFNDFVHQQVSAKITGIDFYV